MPWHLHTHRKSDGHSDHVRQLLGPDVAGAVLAARESRWSGQPFLLDASGRPESLVNSYFASRQFRSLAETTRKKYQLSVRMWLEFCEARGVDWRAAGPDEIADFKFWRMTDDANPSRVSGSTLKGNTSAVSALYSWLQLRHGIQNPVVRPSGPRVGREAARAASPARGRDRAVKWLDPEAVTRWIDVGLRGLDLSGNEDPLSRNRTGTRDAAYAHLLYGSGLRAVEGGSLLLCEVHRNDAARAFSGLRLAAECAKGRFGRRFWVSRRGMDEVMSYVEGPRAEAVRRAQRAGRYPASDEARVVVGAPSAHRLPIRSGGTVDWVSLDALAPADRLGLYRETDRGLEPAMIWLREDGRPHGADRWNKRFATGNERLARLGQGWFQCTPHMLRHSFALRWYAAARLVWEARLNHLTQNEQRDFRAQFGDTWQFVQKLLGHRHPQTTVDVYLEPFKSLEVDVLLECADASALSPLLREILAGDARVLHVPDLLT